VTTIKIVDGKGRILATVISDLVPRVGEYIQYILEQALVTRVMTVYDRKEDWVMVTVEVQT
jgi:hypothetical protein